MTKAYNRTPVATKPQDERKCDKSLQQGNCVEYCRIEQNVTKRGKKHWIKGAQVRWKFSHLGTFKQMWQVFNKASVASRIKQKCDKSFQQGNCSKKAWIKQMWQKLATMQVW